MGKIVVPLLLLIVSMAIPLFLSLQMNNGHFVYTLDDPYIHLALASNISRGHYGINFAEPTAPSSSVLWPFLLVPFVPTGFFTLAPFFLNALLMVFTGLILYRFFSRENLLIFAVSVFTFNLAGLVFTGMEHSLQVLLIVLTAWGAIEFTRERVCPRWLFAVLVLAPLVRYECLSVTLPVLFFLFAAGERKASLITALVLLLCLGGFSLFLVNLGLDPLPASVFAKSSVVGDGGTIQSLLENLQVSLGTFRGVVLALLLLPLVSYCCRRRNDRLERLLAAVTAAALILHLLAGRFGWFHRYGVYIWVYSIMVCFHLYRDFIGRHRLVSALLLAAAGGNYITGYIRIPHASSNIYRQQYQMSRFVHDWLDEPVAVNDLGLVALDCNHYVLDLWGLATPEALLGARDPLWVDSAAAARGVNCAIVYMDEIPGIQHWQRVAGMELHPPLVVCAAGGIDFLAAPWADSDSLAAKIESFAETLPDGIDLVRYR